MPELPPQLTLRAGVLGIVLSAVLAGANAYLGLFAGLTVSASIPAAVISMAVLKLMRRPGVLENNIVQTTASAGEAIAAGAIFTFPALVLLDYWHTFDYGWVTAIAGLGGLLGVLFTVPLRRSLIVEQQLAFPEGQATAEVLAAGSGRGIRYLTAAGITGALIKLAETGFRLWPGTAQAAGVIGQSTLLYVGTNLSPALVGVGYIVGLNIATLVFLGGAISWYAAIPVFSAFFLQSDPDIAGQLASGASAADVAGAIWSSHIRYLGVGAMVVGGIWALISIRGSIARALRSGLDSADRHAAAVVPHTDRDIPMRWVLIATAVAVVPLAVLYYFVVPSIGATLAMSVVMIAAGFLFSAVAGYMAGLVGSSNNPVSGITIATILFTALVLLGVLGSASELGPPAAILVGAVVCCAAAIGSDNMQDLKAGYVLGATPWRQQIMQCVGVVSAALVMAPILNLLLSAYGIGTPTADQPSALAAPQAQIMATVAAGIFGAGLPWSMIVTGGLVGVAIIALDEYLRARGAAWRTPVLAVAVGIYLPLEVSVPIFAGGLLAHAASRYAARRAGGADEAAESGNGMLFAAGLITGEAMVGIIMAVPIVLSGDVDVFALGVRLPALVGLGVLGAVGFALYRTARQDGARR